MTPSVSIALVLLATASGEFVVVNPSPGEARHGPLAASLNVSQSTEAKGEVLLRVVLRNVSDERASFLLERPGVEFFVKGRRGAVVYASVRCMPPGPCGSGLPEPAALEPGEQMVFVERWHPRGGCLPPGAYSVKAKLRAYPGRRRSAAGDVEAAVPFTLRTEISVRGDAGCGRVVDDGRARFTLERGDGHHAASPTRTTRPPDQALVRV